MDLQRDLVDFAKWLDAGASTVVGDPADLARAYLTERSQRAQLVPGTSGVPTGN